MDVFQLKSALAALILRPERHDSVKPIIVEIRRNSSA
jgi:hypothetical protein